MLTRANQFRRELLALSQRVEQLRAGVQAGVDSQTAVEEALAELQTTLEELRVAEEQLRQQNEELDMAHAVLERERMRYQDLFEFAPDAYLVTDLGGAVQEANHAACELLGLVPRLIYGKPLLTFVPPESRSLFRSLLSRVRGGGTVRELELLLRPRGRSPFQAALTVAPVRDPDGGLSSLRWMLRDITPQREAEQTRTALHREQGARRAAEEAVQIRNEFIATVSHDLKSPLTVIKGYVRLLQRGKTHDPEPYLETINQQVDAMRRILDQLLDAANLQMGQPLHLELAAVDLAELAERVADQHRQTTERHELRLEVPPLGTVVGRWDATRLEQIVGNLVGNAIKYSPRGGVVQVSVERQPGWAQLAVRDQGVGIPPEALPHLFELFYRASDQEKSESGPRIGGRGLGLFSAQRLAKLHGGRIEVESEVGRGSVFTLLLPLE